MKQDFLAMARRERGAATLVVVMMLFLVMALLAAYANRSLVFEQRMAGSYVRSSLAQEAAEAGLEWTLAQLNGPPIDAACLPANVGAQRFAERYLNINAADRDIVLLSGSGVMVVDCARDLANAGWACRCPAATAARTLPTAIDAAELTPSFGVQFASGPRPGTVAVQVVGCTDSIVDQCGSSTEAAPARSRLQTAKSRVDTLVGLVSAVRNPPASPLIVQGDLVVTGAGGLGLHNTDPRSAGLLLATGGTATGLVDSRLDSVPGTALNQASIQNDPILAAASADGVFKMFMGAAPSRYLQHPALRQVTCNGECFSALQAAYNAGQRILWVQGPLQINSSQALGSLGDPVLIIATGTVTLGGAFQLNGMLVSGGTLTWTQAGGASALINGIVLAQGAMQTDGRMDIVYQQTVADQLRNRMGSFVKASGSWIDNIGL